ncbi:hypothetical protein HDU81_000212 [Chytriomyces hyalinus]|nr:hypothetical protein HDU81_000212 [Chytriomyces hyalinus]
MSQILQPSAAFAHSPTAAAVAAETFLLPKQRSLSPYPVLQNIKRRQQPVQLVERNKEPSRQSDACHPKLASTASSDPNLDTKPCLAIVAFKDLSEWEHALQTNETEYEMWSPSLDKISIQSSPNQSESCDQSGSISTKPAGRKFEVHKEVAFASQTLRHIYTSSHNFAESHENIVQLPFDETTLIQLIVFLYAQSLDSDMPQPKSRTSHFEPNLRDALLIMDAALYLDLPILVEKCSDLCARNIHQIESFENLPHPLVCDILKRISPIDLWFIETNPTLNLHSHSMQRLWSQHHLRNVSITMSNKKQDYEHAMKLYSCLVESCSFLASWCDSWSLMDTLGVAYIRGQLLSPPSPVDDSTVRRDILAKADGGVGGFARHACVAWIMDGLLSVRNTHAFQTCLQIAKSEGGSVSWLRLRFGGEKRWELEKSGCHTGGSGKGGSIKPDHEAMLVEQHGDLIKCLPGLCMVAVQIDGVLSETEWKVLGCILRHFSGNCELVLSCWGGASLKNSVETVLNQIAACKHFSSSVPPPTTVGATSAVPLKKLIVSSASKLTSETNSAIPRQSNTLHCRSLKITIRRSHDSVGLIGAEVSQILGRSLFHSFVVECIDLSKQIVSEEGAITLAQYLEAHSGQIKKLVLSSCQLSGQAIAGIAPKCQDLVHLDIANNLLDEDAFQSNAALAISKLIASPKCQLKELRLAGNMLSPSGNYAVANAVGVNKRLVKLDLSHIDLGLAFPEVCRKLAAVGSKLEYLEVSHVGVLPRMFQQAVEALSQSGGHLRRLGMAGNMMPSDVGTLFSALFNKSCFQQLQQLDLSGTSSSGGIHLGDQGCQQLLHGLIGNASLKHLNLSCQRVSDSSCSQIVQLLQRCGLEAVVLMRNLIADEGVGELVRYLNSAQRSTRLFIDVEHNYVSVEMRKRLKRYECGMHVVHVGRQREYSSIEYAVKKSTTPLLKPIKQKHTQTLGELTYGREIHVLFRTLGGKMHEPNWIVVFKTLLLIHILMREANVDAIMRELMDYPDIISVEYFRDKSMNSSSVAQTKNIKLYARYLQGKVSGFRELKYDFVRSKVEIISKYRTGNVDMDFMKQLEKLQVQISLLLDCSFYTEELDNYVTLQCFRVLIGDMLSLFHILNEGVIKMLGEYFELPRSEALKGLNIYKTFATQTSKTVTFFETARRLGDSLGIDVPVFKHAPISLAGALEDYVNAPDFEFQQEAFQNKKAAKSQPAKKDDSHQKPSQSQSQQQASKATHVEAPISSPVKQANVLIDFFSSTDESQYSFNAPAINTWAQPTTGLEFQNLTISNQISAGAASLSAGANAYALSSGSTTLSNPATGGISAVSNPFAQQGAGMAPNPQFGQQTAGFGGFAGGAQFGMGQHAPQMNSQFGGNAGGDASFTVDNVFGNGGAGAAGVANPFGSAATSASFASSNPFGSAPISPPSTSKNGSNNPFGQAPPMAAPVPPAVSLSGSNNPFQNSGTQQQPPLPMSPTNSQFNQARGNGLPFGASLQPQQQQQQFGMGGANANGFPPQANGFMGQQGQQQLPFGSQMNPMMGSQQPQQNTTMFSNQMNPMMGGGAYNSTPAGGFQQQPQQQQQAFMSAGNQFGNVQRSMSTGPTTQVVDPLAGVNPFAKPNIPLSAMASSGGMGAPLYGGNMGMSFNSAGVGAANPMAGMPSVQRNNSNNPFFK